MSQHASVFNSSRTRPDKGFHDNQLERTGKHTNIRTVQWNMIAINSDSEESLYPSIGATSSCLQNGACPLFSNQFVLRERESGSRCWRVRRSADRVCCILYENLIPSRNRTKRRKISCRELKPSLFLQKLLWILVQRRENEKHGKREADKVRGNVAGIGIMMVPSSLVHPYCKSLSVYSETCLA